jgi:prepilin-type N-terminal cleavage/methylation domain-containing protein
MLQVTHKKGKIIKVSGFTLVELLVSVTILGLTSIIAVQSLYDSLSIRSKQQTIENSSDSFRIVVRLITNAVVEAKSVDISSGLKEVKMKETLLYYLRKLRVFRAFRPRMVFPK